MLLIRKLGLHALKALIFWENTGRLKQTAGWIVFKGKKLALNKNGKFAYKPLVQRLLSDGSMAQLPQTARFPAPCM